MLYLPVVKMNQPQSIEKRIYLKPWNRKRILTGQEFPKYVLPILWSVPSGSCLRESVFHTLDTKESPEAETQEV